MKNNSGITIMNLVITIVVMVIMISIVGYYSIDSVKNAHVSNEKKEMNNVLGYMGILKAKLLVDEFSLSGDTVISSSDLDTFSDGLTVKQIDDIKAVNESSLNSNYKYHYIKKEMFADKDFSDGNTVVKDVRNNYIINFYTGTVIGKYETRVEVSGIVFGLDNIPNYNG